ncbi:hypothetical protein SAMN05421800_102345 [Chryseobacterium balustinum]|uniref:Uncharacterized protein n=1 Tax=Chryseobacterium balustinum TaxID=246 RepID=A0ABY1L8R2_9FLAO|nr:hypothetical protein SAMN05421800_102345 [Chryseobacterium balustinum]
MRFFKINQFTTNTNLNKTFKALQSKNFTYLLNFD